MDLVDGNPTGSVRISFGYMSTLREADKFVSFVEENFQDLSGIGGSGGINSDVMDINSRVIGGNCNDVIDENGAVRQDSTGEGDSCKDSREQDSVEEREKERQEDDCREVGTETPRRIRVGDKVTATSSSGKPLPRFSSNHH